MANLAKWTTPGAWTSQISTGLNSLANAAYADSADIANGTNLDLYLDVSIILASLTPSGTPYVELHMRPLMDDGTNYADRSAATLIDTLPVASGTAAKYLFLPRIVMPPGSFKLTLGNFCGVALAASANTLKTRAYEENLNA